MFDLLKHRDYCKLYNHKLRGSRVASEHGSERNDSYPLFQVRFNFHIEVERLESPLQLVTVNVGPFAIAELALWFKLHVVYYEAMSTWFGIHFIVLGHRCAEKEI